MGVKRRDADFESGGDRCAGWLYLPTLPDEPPPVVVMAHGLGGERAWRLPAYAERFGELGLAVLLFDYRGFGESDGEPRHVIDPSAQLADWATAVDHARSLDAVDGSRLALWGTSFSGGHVVRTAADDGDVDAVVAQVPFSDGRANTLHVMREGGLSYARAAMGASARDAVRRLTRRDPYYVPVAADPDAFGVLNTPGALDGFQSIVDDEEDLANECAARLLFSIPWYRPVSSARDVDCPVFVAEATEDRIVPSGTVDALVDRLPDVERVRYDTNHFGVYTGDTFERVVAREGEFLARHLL